MGTIHKYRQTQCMDKFGFTNQSVCPGVECTGTECGQLLILEENMLYEDRLQNVNERATIFSKCAW